jgi:hypothetical protein
MATLVLKDASVVVNSVNISSWISEVSIETERDEVDFTAMGAVNKVTKAGLGDATITMTAFSDYAAAAIDATMWPLSTSDTPFTVTVKPTSAATSATNPAYSMSALLFNYTPISGSIGDAASTPLSFRNAAQAGLTRATA